MRRFLFVILIFMISLSFAVAIDVPEDDLDLSDNKVSRYKKVSFSTAPYGGTLIEFGFRNNAESQLSDKIVELELGDMRPDGKIIATKRIQAYWDLISYSSNTGFTLTLSMEGPLTVTDTDKGIPWTVEWISGNTPYSLDSSDTSKYREKLVDYTETDGQVANYLNLELTALFDPDDIVLDTYDGTLSLTLETT